MFVDFSFSCDVIFSVLHGQLLQQLYAALLSCPQSSFVVLFSTVLFVLS